MDVECVLFADRAPVAYRDGRKNAMLMKAFGTAAGIGGHGRNGSRERRALPLRCLEGGESGKREGLWCKYGMHLDARHKVPIWHACGNYQKW